jgi:tubulin polyglutamylase TTLL2
MVVKDKTVLVFRLSKDKGPPIVREVLEEKGWREFNEEIDAEQEYHLWWKTQRFTKSELAKCSYYNSIKQWLNHVPNSSAMTKKDGLVRTLRKMKGIYGQIYNFIPESFILPNEYVKFTQVYSDEESKKDYRNIWICKPSDLSRGRKIFLFRDLSELNYDCQYVLQRYIHNPLLIHGYKFDLRVYVLVTSFHPLKAYIYKNGLVRFSTEKYDTMEITNKFSHLTNASINKLSKQYDTDKEGIGHGSKWDFNKLWDHLQSQNINTDALWKQIENLLILTLIAFVEFIPQKESSNCFELYGMDVIIDQNLKSSLLEANYSPALSIDCPLDDLVKRPLINDVVDILQFKPQVNVQSSVSGTTRKPSIPKQGTHSSSGTRSIRGTTHNETKGFQKQYIGDFETLFPFNSVTERIALDLSKKVCCCIYSVVILIVFILFQPAESIKNIIAHVKSR